MNEQMSYFSSVSDEWSRDLKSVQVQKQRSCREESPDPSMSKIVLRNLIISSKYYKEEEAKELLEVITAERLETEQRQKLEQQEQLSIEKKNFRKAKRNSDETFSQFASRLISMWLYYCNLRGANDFESVNQLIVADKMFEMLDSETATHIGVLQGEEWKNFDKGKVTEIKKFACFTCGSYKHFKRNCPKNKEVDNKRLNVNKVSTEGTELVDGTVAARVDLLDGKLVHALLDSGTEITVIKKDLVPGISVEGASTIYLKGIFGPAVKCALVYVPIGLATGGQVNVVHQQVLCALAEGLVEDVLLPPEVLDMLGGAQSEENSLAQSSQDLRVDSGNVDETKVSSGILPEKAQEHIEDSQRNITSCRNEVGTLGTKYEEMTAEMDKGSMVADSFRSNRSVVPS
ncbi:CCHC-type domain-containing protein [Trichonephila clavipes]|nr:CCHC-type domain-containing protein [Trichonephila clavipes]